MAEYIERKAVIAKLNKAYDNMNALSPQFYCGYQNAVHRIKDFPAAEVELVNHGEWKDRPEIKSFKHTNIPVVECSNCGIIFCDIINNHRYMYHYCPYCGAKMDGGSGNG